MQEPSWTRLSTPTQTFMLWLSGLPAHGAKTGVGHSGDLARSAEAAPAMISSLSILPIPAARRAGALSTSRKIEGARIAVGALDGAGVLWDAASRTTWG